MPDTCLPKRWPEDNRLFFFFGSHKTLRHERVLGARGIIQLKGCIWQTLSCLEQMWVGYREKREGHRCRVCESYLPNPFLRHLKCITQHEMPLHQGRKEQTQQGSPSWQVPLAGRLTPSTKCPCGQAGQVCWSYPTLVKSTR